MKIVKFVLSIILNLNNSSKYFIPSNYVYDIFTLKFDIINFKKYISLIK